MKKALSNEGARESDSGSELRPKVLQLLTEQQPMHRLRTAP
jgi:hypothetical protein